MEYFNKSLLLLIVTLSSLLLSVHSMRPLFDFPFISPAEAPTPSSMPEKAMFNDFDTKAVTPKVLHFCMGTENPDLCSKTIQPFVSIFFDPIVALHAEMEATLNQSLKVASNIANAIVDPTTAKKALEPLDICQKNYENIIETIKEATELLSQQNVIDAYYKFSSVLSDRSSCEDAFGETPGVDNPFVDDTTAVYELGGNCMAIMDGMVNNHNQFLI